MKINMDKTEHGLYLEGIALFVSKDEVIPKNSTRIKRELYKSFEFPEINSKEHKEWGITPEKGILFLKLEDELKMTVDNFIYNIIRDKAKCLGAKLEFTCLDLAKRLNQNYEYRLCYTSLDELKKT
ncbi:MAG TPA: hypothetical protein VIO64_05240 [Pseudobacteroides sp.]|uniref:hypothetical protein n=1 Tax=Pseudobacteroides sp. TaxID=1968840 RepID=UPI002F9271F6